MKNKYLEPYAKENNILQLSLFNFHKKKVRETVVEWKDDQGEYKLRCVCKYGVPGIFEQDVYTACMRLWVKKGMTGRGVEVNYSEIARELGLQPRSSVSRIRKSLRKLAMARYEFVQCFVEAREDGTGRIDAYFSLFDSATLFNANSGKSKKKSKSFLVFPRELKQNLELKYYQMLDMAWYRRLPEGLPRRLYEYLEKRRYHSRRKVFTIAEELLCRWLPVKIKHTTKRRETIEKIAGYLIEAGYLKGYEFDRRRKMCLFEYATGGPPEQEETPVQQLLPYETADEEPETSTVGPYEFAIEWISGIKYFRKKNLKAIKGLPKARVVELYPHVKRMWEDGKIKKPGGVYAAFMEGWKDSDLAKEEEDKARREKEKRDQEEREALHRAKVRAYLQEHGKENVFHQGGPIVSVAEEVLRCMNGAGGTMAVPLLEVEIERDFTTRAQLEEEERKRQVEREKKEKARAKKKRKTMAKQDDHREKIQRFLKRHGLEQVTFSGCPVVDFDEDGIVYEKDGEEVRVKYGNVIEGANLKVR